MRKPGLILISVLLATLPAVADISDLRIERNENEAFLGVYIEPELREHFGADENAGLLVAKVYGGSPAESAGLETGDVIVAVDGESIDSPSDIGRALKGKAGEVFDVEVVRDGRTMSFEAEIPDYGF